MIKISEHWSFTWFLTLCFFFFLTIFLFYLSKSPPLFYVRFSLSLLIMRLLLTEFPVIDLWIFINLFSLTEELRVDFFDTLGIWSNKWSWCIMDISSYQYFVILSDDYVYKGIRVFKHCVIVWMDSSKLFSTFSFGIGVFISSYLDGEIHSCSVLSFNGSTFSEVSII